MAANIEVFRDEYAKHVLDIDRGAYLAHISSDYKKDSGDTVVLQSFFVKNTGTSEAKNVTVHAVRSIPGPIKFSVDGETLVTELNMGSISSGAIKGLYVHIEIAKGTQTGLYSPDIYVTFD